MTDAESFEPLEPLADGFRNYVKPEYTVPAEKLLVDRSNLLGLSAPEMTVLVGGMRALDLNHDGVQHGIFTDRRGQLTPDFFSHVLDMTMIWTPTDDDKVFEGRDRVSGELKRTGSRVDLAFGSNSQLRALAEVYAQDDNAGKFVTDFVAAWTKVMEADRFDV